MDRIWSQYRDLNVRQVIFWIVGNEDPHRKRQFAWRSMILPVGTAEEVSDGRMGRKSEEGQFLCVFDSQSS